MEATPLERAPSALVDGRDVWLKREDVHELGAFKWRGALPTLERWRSDVVTASTGNHGAATAWAARRVGVRATVFVPQRVADAKLALLERLGGDVRRVGADVDEAKDEARTFAHDHGVPFFEDGAEPTQFEGYAEIGHEILEVFEPAAVVVPVGNGALAVGVGHAVRDRARCVGVAAAQAPVMADSFHAGRVVEADSADTIADGLAVRVAIPLAVDQLLETLDDMVLVSEVELMRAVAAFHRVGIRAEAAAAAALAALPRIDANGPTVLIVTGRNIDDALLERCLAA
jgi:threonine dehydratase